MYITKREKIIKLGDTVTLRNYEGTFEGYKQYYKTENVKLKAVLGDGIP